MEGSGLSLSGGGELSRSPVEGSGLRWRGAIADGGERSQVEGSDRRWRGVVSGGGERSHVVRSDRWWRGAVSRAARQPEAQPVVLPNSKCSARTLSHSELPVQFILVQFFFLGL